MLSLFPLIAFPFLLIFSYYFLSQQQWRMAFIYAAAIWGVVALFILELLSMGSWVNPVGLTSAWALLDIGLAFFLWKYVFQKHDVRGEIEKYFRKHELKLWDIFFLCIAAVILGVLFVIAVVAPPNNWDSMSYHMSRVAHWDQNQSINHYPSNIFRQLNYTLWPEYAITHFYVLMGSDRFANLIQWFALVGSLFGASLVVRFFGGGLRLQIIGALWVLTLPMAILQSTSTQTDLVVGFWLLSFICFLFHAHKKTWRWFDAVIAGCALGLAFLTKGNGYLFGLPFLIWLGVVLFKQQRGKGLALFGVVFLAAVLVNTPYYVRNIQLTGTLIPPSESQDVMFGKFAWQNTFMSSIYNLSAQLYTPWIPWNHGLDDKVNALTEALKGDNNQISFNGQGFGLATMPFHEDHASNVYHFVFYWIAVFGVVFLLLQRKMRAEAVYLLCIILAGLIFIGVVKWAPWHSRYHLPLFVFMSPLAVVVFTRWWGKPATYGLTTIFLCASLFWVGLNHSRPLWPTNPNHIFKVPRYLQYFKNRPEMIDPTLKMMAFLKQQECHDIGIKVDEDTWEYPLWTSMDYLSDDDFRIEHVFVENASKDLDYPQGAFKPCSIITTKKLGKAVNWQNQFFVRVIEWKEYRVYLSIDYARRLQPNG